MVSSHDWLVFAGLAFSLALSPGPNMIYLISRALCQGKRAGVLSLLGVVSGFIVHMLATALGLSALLMALPHAHDLLRWLGSAYLLYLAWQALKPGAQPLLAPRELPPDPPRKLFVMGFLTNALNPKVAILYLTIFPQFVAAARGSVLLQTLILGGTQILISFAVNLLVVLSAARIAARLARHPQWLRWQRLVLGLILAALALHIALGPAPIS